MKRRSFALIKLLFGVTIISILAAAGVCASAPFDTCIQMLLTSSLT